MKRRIRKEAVNNIKGKSASIGECTEKRKCTLLVEISDYLALVESSINLTESHF